MMGNVRDTVNVMSTILVQHDVAEQSLASVRPMVREGVRKALRENGLADMAESLYLCDTSEDDLRAIRETDVGREMWQVVQVIMHEKKGQLEDGMAGLISWQDSEEDTIRSMRALIRVLMRKPSMGRVLSLLGFNGWTAVKLSSRGVQFVSAVMAAVEDEEHTCITNWIERGGGKGFPGLVETPAVVCKQHGHDQSSVNGQWWKERSLPWVDLQEAQAWCKLCKKFACLPDWSRKWLGEVDVASQLPAVNVWQSQEYRRNYENLIMRLLPQELRIKCNTLGLLGYYQLEEIDVEKRPSQKNALILKVLGSSASLFGTFREILHCIPNCRDIAKELDAVGPTRSTDKACLHARDVLEKNGNVSTPTD